MPLERLRLAKPQRPSGLDQNFALIRISMHHCPVTRVPYNAQDEDISIKQYKYLVKSVSK